MGGAAFTSPVTVDGVPVLGGGGDILSFLQKAGGKTYYVDPVNGTAGGSGSVTDPISTIDIAEGRCVSGNNDIVVIIGNGTALTTTSTYAWDKSYCHLVGIAAPVPWSPRARWTSSGNAATPVVTVSGAGCVFANLQIAQWGSANTSLGCVQVTGSRCAFFNVHFAGIGHATPGGVAGAYSLFLNGAEECAFYGCTIGLDTIARSTTNAEIVVDGATTRILFDKCRVISSGTTAGHLMVKIADTTAIDRLMEFNDTLFYHFYTNHASKLTAAFSVPASTQTHDIVIRGSSGLVGITEWEANDRGQMWILTGAPAAATSGIAVEPAT